MNIAIVLALAAAVVWLPGAGDAADLIGWLVGVLFFAALAWFASRLYRDNRSSLDSLEDSWRAILYVSIAVAALTVTATRRLWESGPGTLVWFLLIAAASFGVVATWREYRRY